MNADTTISPFVAPDSMRMTSVLEKLESLDLSDTQRRDLKSAVRSVCRLIGRAPAEVPANINWVHVRLRRVHPAQAGISAKRFKNIRAGVLKALALCDASRGRSDWLRQPSPDWASLLTAAPDKHDAWKLTQLAQYCSALGVPPDAVRDEHVRGLLQALEEETFIDQPAAKVGAAVAVWNRLRQEHPGWPDVPLASPRKRETWTMPLDEFPPSFSADVDRWLERLANPDLFDPTALARSLRPATIKHRSFQIREAASALVLSGFPRAEVTDLSVLVELVNVKAALRWMMGRFGGRPTEAIQGVAICLQAIARHHVKVSGEHVDELRRLVKRLGRETDGLREKNRRRLLQLEDPENLMMLLHLPARLVAGAERLQAAKPRRAALMLQAALAIEILLNAPMRIGNLAALDLDRHLRTLRRGRQRTVHIHIPADEVKNNKALDYELGAEQTALLERYLAAARPVLLEKPSSALFPTMDGGHKRPQHLSVLIKDTILEHTGLAIHAHLFRSIAGKIHSLVHPGDTVTLSHVLNDSLWTVLQSYAQFERRAALEHYQDSLTRVRRGAGARA